MNRDDRLGLYCQVTRDARDARDVDIKSSVIGDDRQRYSAEFDKMFPNMLHRIRMVAGDNRSFVKIPSIVKSRRIGDRNAVLMPLNKHRHWIKYIEQAKSNDIPWEKKRLDVVWRGCTTGDEYRVCLVRRWFGTYNTTGINVAFSKIVQGQTQLSDLMGDYIPVAEQLKYAFIVSVEGNDVATNLKWILASNSVPIMPNPRFETWLLESQLKPMVHYVPVKPDFSDLDTVLTWCRSNVSKCRKIAEAGKRYIAPFLDDPVAERQLAWRVLHRYLNTRISRPIRPRRYLRRTAV